MRQFLKNTLCLLAVLFLVSLTTACAQPKKSGGFNPKQFEADLEQFIVVNAGLTPKESSKFFPVYRQMTRKMRSLFDEMRRYQHVNPKDEKACADAIRKLDEIDIQLKQTQQEYHARFMFLLPASKVLDIIKAEEKFHRQAFKRMKR